MTELFLYLLLVSPLPAVAVMLKVRSQKARDAERKTYIVAFPSVLEEDRVHAWLRSLSGSIQSGRDRIISVPTIVFEVWATPRGIHHRLRVPWQEADYIVSQLRSLVPGISVTPDESRPTPAWTYGIELGESSPLRQLRIVSTKDLSASILASMQALGGDESLVYQWVLTPALHQAMPSRDNTPMASSVSLGRMLAGQIQASSDEIDDRRRKLSEANFQAVGRIAATANTFKRAEHIVLSVERSLAATRSSSNRITRRRVRASTFPHKVNTSATPLLFPAQFALSELAAVVAWPIGQPFVAGLASGATRHLHATEDIPRIGRVLGHSNYPGAERPIALDYDHAVLHLFCGGSTGQGKSTLMANSFAQDVANGYGGIVIDASNSDSNESLFTRALNYVPHDRLDDVIVLDVDRSRYSPVGFNILDQGNPRIVVDQITDLFSHLYQDTKGVWTRELLFHGLYTLSERPGCAFTDLSTLVAPRTPDEIAWADQVKRGVKDGELKLFWQRWENFTQSDRDRYSQPLLNRAWQLIARPESRNIIGQSVSSFQMRDVLATNKILLVSLRGLPADTSSLLGTLIVNSLWTAAQTLTPDKPNFLYLDEFQLMTRLPMGLDDMLARARKHKLGVTLGTQYLEDLPGELKNAVINNARSRVIFQSSAKEARTWQNEFGKHYVDESDFMRIPKYEAIAQIATASGTATPVTLKALAPLPATGMAAQAVELSSAKYGRPIADVEAQMIARRTAEPTKPSKRPNIGITPWD